MQRGAVCHVQDVRNEQGRTLVATTEGYVFSIENGNELAAGMELTVGPSCGDWCFVLLGDQRLKARVLRTGE